MSVTNKKQQILELVKSGKLTIEEGMAQLKALEAPAKKLYLKISRKGAISVYGLQRMPVTLYMEQWEAFFAFIGSEVPQAFKGLVGTTEAHPVDKYTSDDDKKWLEDARKGLKPHAKVVGSSVHVGLSSKSEETAA